MSDFQPIEIVRTLNEHDVRYVIIGGLAAVLWGSDHHTNDIDVCYERSPDNLRALVTALRAMDAHLRGLPDGVPEIIDERAFRLGDSMTFTTKYGWFDCLGAPAGTTGYKQLLTNATAMDIRPGLAVQVASLDDVIEMKRTAGRPKDMWLVEQLKRLKQLREEMRQRGEKPAGE